MRILFVVPYIPSLIRFRSYNFLKVLAARGHAITLVCLCPPNEPTTSLPQLQSWCEAVHIVPHSRKQILSNLIKASLTSQALQEAYSYSPEAMRLLKELVSRGAYDLVHLEHMRGAVLAEAFPQLPVVFDTVDCISLLFEKLSKNAPSLKNRAMAIVDLRRTRQFESTLSQRFDYIAVTSEIDRQALVGLGNDAERMKVVPVGVDVNYFSPQETERDPLSIIFSGKMSYHANIAAAIDLFEKIMPPVWAEQPQAHLYIVGKDPAPAIQKMSSHPQVTVTGFVPDIRLHLAQASVAVAPMRYGVGMQTKVLEAMAMATPVVCRPQAASTLSARNGQDILIGETPESIARHILDLLAAPEKRKAVGQAGRQYVETYHTWDQAVSSLESLYQSACEARGVLKVT